MEINKTKKITMMTLTALLSLTLAGCNFDENKNEDLTSTSNEINIEDELNDLASKDEIAIDYMIGLKESAEELFQNIEGSENTQKIEEESKKIAVSTWDFLNNEKDVNGVYFRDLSDKGKETVMSIAGLLSVTLDMLVPNLGENIQNFLGEDIVNSAKDAGKAIKNLGENVLDYAYENTDELINQWRK